MRKTGCVYVPLVYYILYLLKGRKNGMKRIKAACICQTLHSMLKEDVGHDYAVKLVKEDFEKYKAKLERNHTQYKIEGVKETENIMADLQRL